jgi:hypothetical protein
VQIQTSDNLPPVDIHITSVGIARNDKLPHRTYLLHCHSCGKEQMQVQGKLTRIISWLEPTDGAVIIHKCPRCQNRFTIQTAPIAAKVMVRITKLDRSEFHCAICSRQIYRDETECSRCGTAYDFRLIESD